MPNSPLVLEPHRDSLDPEEQSIRYDQTPTRPTTSHCNDQTMMLSKPEDSDSKPKALDAQKKAEEVADLERRLADLSTASMSSAPSPAVTQAPPTSTATKSSAGGGKSALLVSLGSAFKAHSDISFV